MAESFKRSFAEDTVASSSFTSRSFSSSSSAKIVPVVLVHRTARYEQRNKGLERFCMAPFGTVLVQVRMLPTVRLKNCVLTW